MKKLTSEQEEEFRKLYTRDNFRYLYLIGKSNGSFRTFRSSQYHWVGRHSYREKIEQPYVLLSRKKNWSADIGEGSRITDHIDLNRLVKLLVQTRWTGFFDSHWHEGILCFLIAENTPIKYRRLIALHEAIEIKLQGVAESNMIDMSEHRKTEKKRQQFLAEEMPRAARYAHQKACEAELYRAIDKGEEFFVGYANWQWEGNDPANAENFFDQAIPGFMSRESELSPAARVVKFYLHLIYGNEDKPEYLLWSIDPKLNTYTLPSRRKSARYNWLRRYIDQVREELIANNQDWYNMRLNS